jgi:hypothetical protein
MKVKQRTVIESKFLSEVKQRTVIRCKVSPINKHSLDLEQAIMEKQEENYACA